MIRIRNLLLFIIFIICGNITYSLDFNVRITPVAAIPAGDAATPYFSLGGGAFLNTDIEVFNMLSAGLELGYYVTPLLNTGTYPSFLTAGAGASFFSYPSSRLALHLGGSGGVYQFSYNELSYSDLWWKVYGDAGFRISPSLVISGGLGYISFKATEEPMYTGILAGISARISFSTEAAAGNINASLEQHEPVFPLHYGIYKQNSIGVITIENKESAEIRNISVSFRADNYASSLMLCGTKNLLRKNESVTMPLYADFSEKIQNFTENGMLPGELVISYELLGSARLASRTLVVPVYNRNAVRWTDPAVLVSFISPNSPEVLDYSKYIVGLARNNLRTGLNRNMQFAMYLFEGLKVGGISYSKDDTTPYTEYHKDPALVDYIQYPFQTLSYRLGDYDDLGILYAAVLESVGIKSAVIPLDDDFIVAFSLDITPQQAEALFDSTDNLLTIADEIWMPLSFSVLREGYINSWYAAVNSLAGAISSAKEINFVILQDAWQTYPPSGIKGHEAAFQKPPEALVVRAVETGLLRYITTEFGPKIRVVQNELRSKGASTQLYNQLGLLYVRAGMYHEAKAEFLKSAELQSAAAMINLGNLEMLDRNHAAAGSWFRKALDLQPESRAALNGLERISALLAE